MCGLPAGWVAADASGEHHLCRCWLHRRDTDRPILGPLPTNLVSVFVEVILAGVDPDTDMASEEAIARLEQAVWRIGGVVSLQSVSSGPGRGCPWLRFQPYARARGV